MKKKVNQLFPFLTLILFILSINVAIAGTAPTGFDDWTIDNNHNISFGSTQVDCSSGWSCNTSIDSKWFVQRELTNLSTNKNYIHFVIAESSGNGSTAKYSDEGFIETTGSTTNNNMALKHRIDTAIMDIEVDIEGGDGNNNAIIWQTIVDTVEELSLYKFCANRDCTDSDDFGAGIPEKVFFSLAISGQKSFGTMYRAATGNDDGSDDKREIWSSVIYPFEILSVAYFNNASDVAFVTGNVTDGEVDSEFSKNMDTGATDVYQRIDLDELQATPNDVQTFDSRLRAVAPSAAVPKGQITLPDGDKTYYFDNDSLFQVAVGQTMSVAELGVDQLFGLLRYENATSIPLFDGGGSVIGRTNGTKIDFNVSFLDVTAEPSVNGALMTGALNTESAVDKNFEMFDKIILTTGDAGIDTVLGLGSIFP